MLVFKTHYADADSTELVMKALDQLLADTDVMPVFICIGSNRHMLDCFGPLTGTMMLEKLPDMPVVGTLEMPLHAKNFGREINSLKQLYAKRTQIAIDASLGSEAELGVIKLRPGPLLPGKALGKRLPPAGDMSIIGIVGTRFSKTASPIHEGSFTPVYHMARVVSNGVTAWFKSRYS